nr:class I SAM-dependent methyltransferase [Lysinibacter cavernae]
MLADLLGRVLIPLSADYAIDLRRAPDVRVACTEAYGPASGESLVSLREIQGVIGAHEWREKGVPVPALGSSIHPHYGVFSPIRGEYLDLVASAPLPDGATVGFDIGTGTGVLAAILAARGVGSVVATDQDTRAVECARDNLERLGYANTVEVLQTDLFPEGRADIIVCNPPWIPAVPVSSLDYAVYDNDSAMLRRFLRLAGEHLTENGEVWLVLSNLAELLQLRRPDELSGIISAAGLTVVGQLQTAPTHARATDTDDPLHAARSAEITSLWRLASAAS